MGFFSDMFKGSGGSIVSGALGAVGGLLGNSQKQAFAREQLQYQQDLHRNQIQWRVEDAKRAGVHPMAALGLSSMSFSPVSSSDYDNWLGEIGQNIDRAIQQGKTQAEREQTQALQDRLTDINIRRGEAEADLAETEAATARFRLQQQLFPAPPPVDSSTGLISGQGDALVNPEPMRTTPYIEIGKEPGSNPSVGWLQNSDGTFSPVMSDEAKNRLEDDFVGELLWTGRNRVMPHLRWVTGYGDNKTSEPPRSLLPKGAKGWRYTGWGSYAPVFD